MAETEAGREYRRTRDRRPRWYFSLRSPYSWFAYRDLTDRYPEVADAIDWLPCWEPDEATAGLLDQAGVELPYVPMSRAKSFYILQDARRLARQRALAMTWPIDRDPRWDIAHLGYVVAQEAGRGREFVDLAYQARWEQGRDLSDRSTVAGIAERLGLDSDRVSGAAEDPEVIARGAEYLIRSYDDGAFGVPFFIHGREKYFGVERLRAFVARFRGVDSEPPPAAVTDDEGGHPGTRELIRPGADAGHAGGCG